MSIFVPNKVYLRGILLHYFIQKKSAAGAHRILVQTYSDNALSDTTCRDWFRRLKNNDFELEDKERSGAPKKFQDKELEQLLDEDPSQTLSELGKILQVDESTVSKRLKGLGMIQKQGHWVPYELKPRDVERRFGTCELLLQRQKRKGFLICWGAHPQLLYRSMFRASIEYGSLIFGLSRSCTFRKLEIIQNHAVRTCLGCRISFLAEGSLTIKSSAYVLNPRIPRELVTFSISIKKTKKPWYYRLPLRRESIVSVTRLRVNHYNLKHSLFRKNFIKDPSCDCVGHLVQDADHVLFRCPVYTGHAKYVRSALSNIINFNLNDFVVQGLQNPSPKLCRLLYSFSKASNLQF
ncbi:MOS1T transposase, partial [Pseudoatta argentina]